MYIKVVDQLLTPFIKMAFLFFLLNMCYYYLEREIFLENQVNSFKKELDNCRGRLNRVDKTINIVSYMTQDSCMSNIQIPNVSDE